jgi:hypothetical protein
MSTREPEADWDDANCGGNYRARMDQDESWMERRREGGPVSTDFGQIDDGKKT